MNLRVPRTCACDQTNGDPSLFRLWWHRAKPLRCVLQLALNLTGAARVDPLAPGARQPPTLLLWEAPGMSCKDAKLILDLVDGGLALRAAVVLLGTGVSGGRRGPASEGDGPVSGAARALEEWAGVHCPGVEVSANV